LRLESHATRVHSFIFIWRYLAPFFRLIVCALHLRTSDHPQLPTAPLVLHDPICSQALVRLPSARAAMHFWPPSHRPGVHLAPTPFPLLLSKTATSSRPLPLSARPQGLLPDQLHNSCFSILRHDLASRLLPFRHHRQRQPCSVSAAAPASTTTPIAYIGTRPSDGMRFSAPRRRTGHALLVAPPLHPLPPCCLLPPNTGRR